MVGLMLGWGLNWPASKLALQEIPPLLMRSCTLMVGGLSLLLLAIAFGNKLSIARADWKPFIWMTLFTVTGWQTCMAFGVYLMPAGRASIIGNTVPIWVALLSVWILRERLTAYTAAGIVAGTAGLIVLIGPEIAVLGSAPLGSGLMLLAAIFVSSGAICMKLHSWQTSLTVLTGWALLFGGLPVIVAALITGQQLEVYPVSNAALLGLTYTILVATVFAQWAWFKIMTVFPVTVGASVTFVVPIVAVISSGLMLDEKLGWQEWTSLSLVLAGLFSVLFGPHLMARTTLPAHADLK